MDDPLQAARLEGNVTGSGLTLLTAGKCRTRIRQRPHSPVCSYKSFGQEGTRTWLSRSHHTAVPDKSTKLIAALYTIGNTLLKVSV